MSPRAGIRRVHLRVSEPTTWGVFGRAGQATITITVGGGIALFCVRPLRRRKGYELPLAKVASMVVDNVVKAEAVIARKAKAEARRGRK